MKIDELKNYKKILILGYAIEGQATERFIKKFHPDAEIGIADQKDDPNYLDVQDEYDLAIKTPSLRPENVTIPYTTATNIFMANVPNTIIGVTGTKGKSTTVSLLYELFKRAGKPVQLLGNIGNPMLDALREGISARDTIILELSSYQLEDIEYSPQIACFLNIYKEEHNHPSFESYFQAKARITAHQTEEDVFFYNGKDQKIKEIAHEALSQIQDFTIFDIDDMIRDLDIKFFTPLENLKAVWAIASYFNIEQSDFKHVLESFTGLPHRLAYVDTVKEVQFYNDSGSVHPMSTVFALHEIPNVKTVILGGENRKQDFAPVVDALLENEVECVILFPDTQEIIKEFIDKNPVYYPRMYHCSSMEKAVAYAFENTGEGGVCLLSPGAPSYTMYKNLYERGEDFVSIIKKHASKKKKRSSSKNSSKKTSKKAQKASRKK